jgi:undecaprenyldiphospho-muramoylpentapeptide beta-N-acetylglucosaminyltransferase
MKLMLGGGGSGGHVFPGLAVADALRACTEDVLDVLYVGTEDGIESTIARDAEVPFEAVASRAVRGRNLVSQAYSLVTIASGVAEAVGIMRRFRPNVVLVTGGYASVPVGVAAVLTRTPLVVFQPDIVPGWAVQLLSRLATRVCAAHPSANVAASAKRTVYTGYPLRPVFAELDRPMARAHFQLNTVPALLVSGAVQGARHINTAIADGLDGLIGQAQIIHVTGSNDWARMNARRDALPEVVRHRYHVYEYLGDELPTAMAACDLAISRSGASVLAEYPAAGLPSILIPLPEAGGHQRHNAQVLERAGAAVVLDDRDLDARLISTVEELLTDDAHRAAMARSASAQAQPDAAARIARVLWEVRR